MLQGGINDFLIFAAIKELPFFTLVIFVVYFFSSLTAMDRMSIASGASGQSSVVSDQVLDDFKPLYQHFLNSHPFIEHSREVAEKDSKKCIKALKLIGFTYSQLDKWVKQKKGANPRDAKFANKKLWEKLNDLQRFHKLPNGVSKSKIADSTVEFLEKRRDDSECEIIDIDDDDDAPPRPGPAPRPQEQPQPKIEPLQPLEENLFLMIRQKIGDKILSINPNGFNQASLDQAVNNVIDIVTNKTSFNGTNLLITYSADQKKMQVILIF